MRRRDLPQIVIFDGATGAGKSSLLEHLREKYSQTIFVGSKFTTRERRLGDNSWEFRFVDYVPDESRSYSFESVGNTYAVDNVELTQAIDRGLVYAISCVDRSVLELLSSNFTTLISYVYRIWFNMDFDALLASRGTVDQVELQLRRDELSLASLEYLHKLDLYAHTILNIGPKERLLQQLQRILSLYGITPDIQQRT